MNSSYAPLSDRDIEVVRTTIFISNMQSEKTTKLLSDAYEKSDNDIYIKLSYALYNFYAKLSDDMLKKKIRIESSLVALDEILEVRPDYWLAKLYKIRILLLLPQNYIDLDEIFEGLEEMIEVQKESEYYPYFIAPYILLATAYLSLSDLNKVKNIIEEAEKLKKGKITGITKYIKPIFNKLEKQLITANCNSEAERIHKLMLAYI